MRICRIVSIIIWTTKIGLLEQIECAQLITLPSKLTIWTATIENIPSRKWSMLFPKRENVCQADNSQPWGCYRAAD